MTTTPMLFDPITERRPVKTSLPPRPQEEPTIRGLTTALGCFSIGLGLAELLAPHKTAARTGVPYPTLIRAFGLREIVAGVGILTSRDPGPWLWARVAGDVLDLAALGVSCAEVGPSGQRRALQAGVAVAAVAALDVIAASAHDGTASD